MAESNTDVSAGPAQQDAMEQIITESAAVGLAAECRKVGNDLYTSGDFSGAITKYSEALSMPAPPEKIDAHVLLSNRAACYLKLRSFDQVVEDCTKSLDLQPDYIKSLARRSEAFEGLGKLDEALKDCQAAAAAAKAQGSSISKSLDLRAATLKTEVDAKFEREKDEMLGASFS